MQLTEKVKCCQLELMVGNLVCQVASLIPPTCGVINMSPSRSKIAYKQPLNTFSLNIGLPGIGKSPAVSLLIHEPAKLIEEALGYHHVIDKMTITGIESHHYVLPDEENPKNSDSGLACWKPRCADRSLSNQTAERKHCESSGNGLTNMGRTSVSLCLVGYMLKWHFKMCVVICMIAVIGLQL